MAAARALAAGNRVKIMIRGLQAALRSPPARVPFPIGARLQTASD